jgi:hypothetical protein
LTSTAGRCRFGQLFVVSCQLLRPFGARRCLAVAQRVAAQHRDAVGRTAEPAIATGGALRGGESRSRTLVYRPRSCKVRSALLASACVMYILLKQTDLIERRRLRRSRSLFGPVLRSSNDQILRMFTAFTPLLERETGTWIVHAPAERPATTAPSPRPSPGGRGRLEPPSHPCPAVATGCTAGGESDLVAGVATWRL